MSPPQTCVICQKPLAEGEATRQEVVFEDGGFKSHLIHERCPSAAIRKWKMTLYAVIIRSSTRT